MPTQLGERIRELRKAKNYTLDRLGELSDSSKSYIWELENKDPPRPSADKIAKIAEALGVTGDYLTGAADTLETAEDQAFFRKYSQMPPKTRLKLREIANLLDDDGDE